MGTIILILGLVCTIWCILDIFKQNITTAGKVIITVVLLLTNWIGIAVYYLWARHHLTEWFK